MSTSVRKQSKASGMDKIKQRTTWQRYRKLVIGAVVSIIAVLGLIALLPEEGRILRVSHGHIVISSVSQGQFDDFIPVRGRVSPLQTVFLDAIEGGQVEAVHVEDGQYVEQGQPIIDLSNTSLQLDVISREAQVTEQLNNLRNTELALEQNRLAHKRNLVEINYNLTRLQREIKRLQPLATKGLVADDQLEQLEDEYNYYKARHEVTLESQATDKRIQEAQMEQLEVAGEQLQRNLAVARRNLESLQVKAPVSGKVTAFNLEIGQALNKGDNIGQIDDPDHFKVTANVDEFYLSRVDLEQTARVTLDNQEHELVIRKVYPQVLNGSFEVDLEFMREQPANIRRGQTLQLNLQLGSPSESLLIPNGAFYQDTGGQWVFVVTPDKQQAIRRNVRLGRRNPRFIEVLDGLEPGEQVVTSPYSNYLDMDRLMLQDQ